MEELKDKSTSARKIYLVSMKSVPDTKGGKSVTIRGYYAEPTAEGKYPTIIYYQGTDGGTGTPWCMNADDNQNTVSSSSQLAVKCSTIASQT